MSTTTFEVAGMTCQHCVSSVTQEVRKIGGVSAVQIDLVPGGASRLVVTAETPVDAAAVQVAVDEAGYALTGPRS
jgi:copper chaperone CopZ